MGLLMLANPTPSPLVANFHCLILQALSLNPKPNPSPHVANFSWLIPQALFTNPTNRIISAIYASFSQAVPQEQRIGCGERSLRPYQKKEHQKVSDEDTSSSAIKTDQQPHTSHEELDNAAAWSLNHKPNTSPLVAKFNCLIPQAMFTWLKVTPTHSLFSPTSIWSLSWLQMFNWGVMTNPKAEIQNFRPKMAFWTPRGFWHEGEWRGAIRSQMSGAYWPENMTHHIQGSTLLITP